MGLFKYLRRLVALGVMELTARVLDVRLLRERKDVADGEDELGRALARRLNLPAGSVIVRMKVYETGEVLPTVELTRDVSEAQLDEVRKFVDDLRGVRQNVRAPEASYN